MRPDVAHQGFAGLRAYFRDGDADAQARNTIALIVSWNIPFYPLYVAWIVGWQKAWPALLAWPSLPLFLLVPAANRWSGRAGRVCLLIAGLVDTGFCTQSVGAASGVELFYVPVSLLPLVVYREAGVRERAVMAIAVAVVFILGRFGAGGWMAYAAQEFSSLTWMNAVSVGALSAVILFLRWRLPARAGG